MKLTLAEKRGAFDEYRAKWEASEPTSKWQRTVGNILGNGGAPTQALGVYAFTATSANPVEFLTLEFVSQGIPRKE